MVGNPLRAALLAAPPSRAAARCEYGLDADRPVVGILGGSQGADALNRAAGELVATPAYQVLHLAGREQHDRWSGLSADVADWTVLPFEAEMRFFYAAADLVIARAGALTVSELAATGTPSILVPYPDAASHQDANAADLAEAGGAVVLPQTELEPPRAPKIPPPWSRPSSRGGGRRRWRGGDPMPPARSLLSSGRPPVAELPDRIHIVGVGGSGMSGLAKLLAQIRSHGHRL